MAQDAGIAFAQNLVDRYIQFKLIQRREKRYSDQLQENRLYNQQRLGIAKGHLELARERLNQPSTNISIFSPGQMAAIDKSAVTAAGNIPMTTEGGFLGIGGTDFVRKEDVLKEYKAQQARAGYYGMNPIQQEQFDAAFDSTILSGEADKVEWSPEFDSDILRLRPYKEIPNYMFKSGTPTEPTSGTAFPSGQEDLTQLSDEELRRIIGGQSSTGEIP